MTRFLVLTAIALVLAIWFVVADIRRMRRARDARKFIATGTFGDCHLSDGHHSFAFVAHTQGHEDGRDKGSYEPLSA